MKDKSFDTRTVFHERERFESRNCRAREQCYWERQVESSKENRRNFEGSLPMEEERDWTSSSVGVCSGAASAMAGVSIAPRGSAIV